MSKASEWVAQRTRSEADRPTFNTLIKVVNGDEEESWGHVTDDGDVFLAFEDQQVTLPAACALVIARWLLDTLDDTP